MNNNQNMNNNVNNQVPVFEQQTSSNVDQTQVPVFTQQPNNVVVNNQQPHNAVVNNQQPQQQFNPNLGPNQNIQNAVNQTPKYKNMDAVVGFDYSNNAPALQVRNLHKTFENGSVSKKVLSGVNLTVNRGDVYGLIGLNGSGKTTLFKSILGINDCSCDGISLFGSQSMNQFQYNQQFIGFFITNYFISNKTAYENLEYYAKLKNIFNQQEINMLLEQVGLLGVNAPVGSFSLGMKQRLGIATAFLGNPSLIILDEPANGLDPEAMVSVRQLIKYYNQNYNTTFLVSSHYLKSLAEICNRFGRLENGMITGEITTKEIMQNTNSEVNVKLTQDQFKMLSEVLNMMGVEENINVNEEEVLLDFLNNGGKHE